MNDNYLYDKDGKFIGKISNEPPRSSNPELDKNIEKIALWLFPGAIAILVFFAPGALITYLFKIPKNSIAEWVIVIGVSSVFWGMLFWWFFCRNKKQK